MHIIYFRVPTQAVDQKLSVADRMRQFGHQKHDKPNIIRQPSMPDRSSKPSRIPTTQSSTDQGSHGAKLPACVPSEHQPTSISQIQTTSQTQESQGTDKGTNGTSAGVRHLSKMFERCNSSTGHGTDGTDTAVTSSATGLSKPPWAAIV